jgi:hypothetical protein
MASRPLTQEQLDDIGCDPLDSGWILTNSFMLVIYWGVQLALKEAIDALKNIDRYDDQR